MHYCIARNRPRLCEGPWTRSCGCLLSIFTGTGETLIMTMSKNRSWPSARQLQYVSYMGPRKFMEHLFFHSWAVFLFVVWLGHFFCFGFYFWNRVTSSLSWAWTLDPPDSSSQERRCDHRYAPLYQSHYGFSQAGHSHFLPLRFIFQMSKRKNILGLAPEENPKTESRLWWAVSTNLQDVSSGKKTVHPQWGLREQEASAGEGAGHRSMTLTVWSPKSMER